MIKKIATFLSLIFCLLHQSTHAQEHNFLEKPYLETAATYTKEVMPDRIYLHIRIAEKDSKGKVSIEALEQQMTATLKGLGIDVLKQLEVADIASDHKRYLLRKKDILKEKDFLLTLYDAKTMGQVVQALEQRQIANISVKDMAYSDLENLKIELRSKAIEKAKRQAEALLAPLGQKPGKALYISDTNTAANTIVNSAYRGTNSYYRAEDVTGYSEGLNVQKIKVMITVVIYFEIL